MSEAARSRPGIALGRYPERADERQAWLDRVAGAAFGMLRRNFGRNNLDRDFVDLVAAAAHGLDRLDERAISAIVAELRHELHRHGLRPDLVARSFALIRELAGRRLGIRHFDVQLAGGWAMVRGKIAEMETGEGKTLTATLPAATAALAGIPVHIITVNDFLVSRDAAWMKPVYDALGLSVGTVLEGMALAERRRAYGCAITYCTNKQIVFDYLKDRLLLQQENRALHLRIEGLHRNEPRVHKLMMRGLCFAIVDEADSVLVDEARTPLIISGGQAAGDQERIYLQALDAARRMRQGRDYVIRERDRHLDLTELGKAHAVRLTERQGGVMPDRSWERGLHQMVEAKEGLEISGRQETLARISYQRFFRRYLRLAGMTGTAREVAGELWSVYRLDVVRVPTNRRSARRQHADSIHSTSAEKWRTIAARVRELNGAGRPVLVGTRSVADSEHLSRLLDEGGIPHSVLNARQNQAEAEIIAQAGQPHRVTVATNMAGRGTDIKLAEGMAEAGGLWVIASERHDARRIDRQLFGRCGRQGDPGECQAIVSLDDDLIRGVFGKLLNRIRPAGGKVPHWLGRALFGWAQRTMQRRHSEIRRRLLHSDDNLQDLLAFSGRGE